MDYPEKLAEIIEFFEMLPDEEKRENLILYADNSRYQEPEEGVSYSLVDVRKDEECTDTVGVYLTVDDDERVHFRIALGPHVQTLTRAMTTILCKGLDGLTSEEVLQVPQDFVPRIVGAELIRARSQTVYYILSRMKAACKVYLDRERAKG